MEFSTALEASHVYTVRVYLKTYMHMAGGQGESREKEKSQACSITFPIVTPLLKRPMENCNLMTTLRNYLDGWTDNR